MTRLCVYALLTFSFVSFVVCNHMFELAGIQQNGAGMMRLRETDAIPIAAEDSLLGSTL